jgi:hypothetical protein
MAAFQNQCDDVARRIRIDGADSQRPRTGSARRWLRIVHHLFRLHRIRDARAGFDRYGALRAAGTVYRTVAHPRNSAPDSRRSPTSPQQTIEGVRTWC